MLSSILLYATILVLGIPLAVFACLTTCLALLALSLRALLVYIELASVVIQSYCFASPTTTAATAATATTTELLPNGCSSPSSSPSPSSSSSYSTRRPADGEGGGSVRRRNASRSPFPPYYPSPSPARSPPSGIVRGGGGRSGSSRNGSRSGSRVRKSDDNNGNDDDDDDDHGGSGGGGGGGGGVGGGGDGSDSGILMMMGLPRAGPAYTPPAVRDYEGVGGWRFVTGPGEEHEKRKGEGGADGAKGRSNNVGGDQWAVFNSRLELPAAPERKRRHRRSLTGGKYSVYSGYSERNGAACSGTDSLPPGERKLLLTQGSSAWLPSHKPSSSTHTDAATVPSSPTASGGGGGGGYDDAHFSSLSQSVPDLGGVSPAAAAFGGGGYDGGGYDGGGGSSGHSLLAPRRRASLPLSYLPASKSTPSLTLSRAPPQLMAERSVVG